MEYSYPKLDRKKAVIQLERDRAELKKLLGIKSIRNKKNKMSKYNKARKKYGKHQMINALMADFIHKGKEIHELQKSKNEHTLLER